MMVHLIKKQSIYLSIPLQVNAFSLQHEVSRSYRNVIVPQLEKLFDRIAGTDEIIEIDKLEIDAGIFTIDQIEHNQWADEISEQISRRLEEMIRSNSESTGISFTGLGMSGFRQWMYYMQKGYLPWNNKIRGEEWHRQVFETLAADYNSVTELRKLVLANAYVRERIVYQHDELFIEKLITILTARTQKGLKEIVDEMTELFFLARRKETLFQHAPYREIRQSIYRAVLVLSSVNKKPGPAEFAEIICSLWVRNAGTVSKLAGLPVIRNNTVWKLVEKLTDKRNQAQLLQKDQAAIPGKRILPGTNDNNEDREQMAGSQKAVNDNKAATPVPDDIIMTETFITGRVVKKQEQPVSHEVSKDIFVSNAGMVMLHCFLYPLFNYLGLIKNNEFTDDNSRLKALQLLYYLATGRDKAPEYDLLIPKILCGYAIDMPVPSGVELTEDEKKETDGLLSEVIAQWKKPISIAGLREGFLQRGGKLFVRNERLNLVVETNTIDVLLTTLPWGMGVIKLPWMPKPLMVDWGGER
ncbi:MAG: hypothetical protein KF746_21050 [Chitinophagaceae bacterium]|nr:hypothetical protein [Chitinophagaceae bacterium]